MKTKQIAHAALEKRALVPLLALALLTRRVSSDEVADTIARNGAKVSLVKDIWYGPDGFQPSHFVGVPSAGKIFFVADDGEHGREPWVSDGTEGGTVMLGDVNPGSAPSNVEDAWDFLGKVFFSANDGTTGQELWVTDLTPGGTALLKDVVPGGVGSFPTEFVELGERLYFVTRSQRNGGAQLWKTDGTEDGTVLVEDFSEVAPGTPDQKVRVRADMGSADGRLLYLSLSLRDGNGTLVRSDGTPSDATGSCTGSPPDTKCDLTGTAVIKFGIDARIRNRNAVIDGRMIFRTAGGELWSTDGTAEGTLPIFTDLMVRGVGRSILNGKVFVRVERWGWLFFTDGTPEGTAPVKLAEGTPFTYQSDIEEEFNVSGYGTLTLFEGAVVNGPVFPELDRQLILVNGVSGGWSRSTTLWTTDGTSGGTELILDMGAVEPFDGDRSPDDNKLFMSLTPGQVWVTDGTEGGTHILADFGMEGHYDWGNSLISSLSDDVVMIGAGREREGLELWRLDLQDTHGASGVDGVDILDIFTSATPQLSAARAIALLCVLLVTLNAW